MMQLKSTPHMHAQTNHEHVPGSDNANNSNNNNNNNNNTVHVSQLPSGF